MISIELMDALQKLVTASVFIHFEDGKSQLFAQVQCIEIEDDSVRIKRDSSELQMNNVKKISVYK